VYIRRHEFLHYSAVVCALPLLVIVNLGRVNDSKIVAEIEAVVMMLKFAKVNTFNKVQAARGDERTVIT
jgi:hypothetical protein